MDARKEFIKALCDSPRGEAPYREFERWCEAVFCSLANGTRLNQAGTDAREARFTRIKEQVGQPRLDRYAEMLGMLVLELKTNGRDVLGPVCMDERVLASNKGAGQFFTPFDVSLMMAKMVIGDASLDERRYVTVAEPACGSGGTLMAAAIVFREAGLDLATQVWMDATDISTLCYHMTFIQLSIVGCAGMVFRDDALMSQPSREGVFTVGAIPFVARHGLPSCYGLPLKPKMPVTLFTEAE